MPFGTHIALAHPAIWKDDRSLVVFVPLRVAVILHPDVGVNGVVSVSVHVLVVVVIVHVLLWLLDGRLRVEGEGFFRLGVIACLVVGRSVPKHSPSQYRGFAAQQRRKEYLVLPSTPACAIEESYSDGHQVRRYAGCTQASTTQSFHAALVRPRRRFLVYQQGDTDHISHTALHAGFRAAFAPLQRSSASWATRMLDTDFLTSCCTKCAVKRYRCCKKSAPRQTAYNSKITSSFINIKISSV